MPDLLEGRLAQQGLRREPGHGPTRGTGTTGARASRLPPGALDAGGPGDLPAPRLGNPRGRERLLVPGDRADPGRPRVDPRVGPAAVRPGRALRKRAAAPGGPRPRDRG